MITLAAAIIVKNEAEHLQKCLNSLSGLSQIVIVDTGSNDNTAQIATRNGCHIIFHKWQNSFADARNIAIRHCWTDWLLAIDADEELVDSEKFLWAINNIEKNIGGIKVTLNNFLNEELTLAKQHSYTRLFRNDKRFHFEGAIHEQITSRILTNHFDIIDMTNELVINHYGYIGKNSEKEERNRSMLEKMVQEDSNDYFAKYHLANTEHSAGNYAQSEKMFLELLKMKNMFSVEQLENIKIKLSQIWLQQNRYGEIYEILDFESADIDVEGLRKSIVGSAYLMQQKFAEAKMLLLSEEVAASKMVDKKIIENTIKIFELLKKSK